MKTMEELTGNVMTDREFFVALCAVEAKLTKAITFEEGAQIVCSHFLERKSLERLKGLYTYVSLKGKKLPVITNWVKEQREFYEKFVELQGQNEIKQIRNYNKTQIIMNEATN